MNQVATIKAALQEIRTKALMRAGDALQEGGEIIAEKARNNLERNGSVFTGNLKKSIHVERMGDSVIKVTASAVGKNGYNYAARIEFSPKVNKPYMYPALNQSKEEIKSLISEAVGGA